NQALNLFEELSQSIPREKYMMYGELFGEVYPHSEVTQNLDVQAIQTRVYESPNNHFFAFDIAIEEIGPPLKILFILPNCYFLF
ncbi:MAG: hypothetical protein HRT68_16095, partial [Flavobacteriaceae bacterium]|nr:hypothetical protein [Flavobacteriaceae bacterium]